MPDAIAVGSIETEAAARGLSSDQVADALASITAAGYQVADAETGDPLTVVDSVACTRKAVSGVAGLFVLTITVATGVDRYVLERTVNGEAQYTPLG